MSEIHAGNVILTYTDERLFAHIRAAISDLIVRDGQSFFIAGEALGGRASVLCGPNLPLMFVGAGIDAEADNDEWVAAITVATAALGRLAIITEDDAAEFLRRNAEQGNDT